jgi:hypothetical protein
MFVLGPFIANVVEPAPPAAPTPGLRGVAFRDPATAPGGKAFLTVLPEQVSGDKAPMGVYAVYADPAKVGDPAGKTPEWFLQGGFPTGHWGSSNPATTDFDIDTPGLPPGVYFLQTVIEYVG